MFTWGFIATRPGPIVVPQRVRGGGDSKRAVEDLKCPLEDVNGDKTINVAVQLWFILRFVLNHCELIKTC